MNFPITDEIELKLIKECDLEEEYKANQLYIGIYQVKKSTYNSIQMLV